MKCTLCDQDGYTPYHITEPNSAGQWQTANLCENCAREYLVEAPKPEPLKMIVDEKYPDSVLIDISKVNSPEELIALITQHQAETDSKPPCPKCGLTLADFDLKGRFGCDNCYKHFSERMTELVYPYHKGAKYHVGKTPKSFQNDIESKRKTLKLQMAHAIELEDYEKAAVIKKMIQDLSDSSSLPSVSLDQ